MQIHDVFIAVVQGLVEGLTEFLPVSSTGHLILVGHYLDFEGSRANTFDIVIQSGAILAVILLFLKRFLRLFDFKDTSGFAGTHGLGKLAIACLPAFLLGPPLHHVIKEYLFAPLPVAFALIVGGIIMIFVESRKKTSTTHRIESITYKQAFIIGVAQCLAMWPGVSRSGSTIIAGMLLGLDRFVAAEFSFLVAAPVLIAATAYELLKSLHDLTMSDMPLFLIGFVVSFISGIIAVKGFFTFIKHVDAQTIRGISNYPWCAGRLFAQLSSGLLTI